MVIGACIVVICDNGGQIREDQNVTGEKADLFQEERAIKRYRSEWKYCEKEADLLALRGKLAKILEHDLYAGENGKYVIHSLYFDDYRNTCARENVAGEGKRFKYRIRYYGDNSGRLWLEKKEKQNSYCYKRKCPVLTEEYHMLMEGGASEVFWNTKYQLMKEFCVDIISKGFMPKVIINYEREAFVEIISNVRITMDYNISASDEIERFLEDDYLKIPILEKKKHVLEVKFDDVLPSYIKAILQSNILEQQSFSKYYLGRIAIQENKKYSKIM